MFFCFSQIGKMVKCDSVDILSAVMVMNTIWEKDIQMPRFPQLKTDLQTDVLIIGGGLTGLLCADRLKRAAVDCVLIEQNRLMSGVSGRTTAKLTSQHGLIYHKLLRKFGQERSQLYRQANEDALTAFRELAATADCDFQEQTNWIYATGGTAKLERELAACTQLDIPVKWERSLPLPFLVAGAIGFSGQAQFHPMKLAAHIADGLNIYEDTKALAFYGNQVQTPKGRITAKAIIVATHFPMLNKHGAYFLKLYQQRSYVIALENAPICNGMYLDCEENGLSLRSAGDWLLLGGGGHRTGKQGRGWSLPETAARTFWPHAHTVARWATQDCMSLDGMPYIGRYSKATPELYVASGFQKWGMSTAMAAAMVLTDLICGKDNPYGALFSPSRSMLHSQLLRNGTEAVTNLLRFGKPRCPHMGCALHWNAAEHSWDCACHGSRFDAEGRLLNGPATGDWKPPPET